ncbi:MAG: adenine deaminase [Chloroflexota bacterium]|nr:adenine deaminase [Chloroflexota bacterium]
MQKFIEGLPKVELHLHIEGSLEPELMFALAKRNHIDLPYQSVEEVRQAYNFTDLQSFLNIYYAGANVLQTEQDFYDLAWAYFSKAHEQNVRHAEIFFDPQTHTDRGIPFETVINGLHRAQVDAQEKLDLSSFLILCFLRHLTPQAALETLAQAQPYKQWIIGVGLDSSEKDRPPSLFAEVYKQARAQGYRSVAHAGEEGPAEYVWEALRLLGSQRIDHGVRSVEDPELLQYLKDKHIPLTVCPLSNVKLCVFPSMKEHNIKQLLDMGLRVTINSDDPAYFGGYMNENFIAAQRDLGLTRDDLYRISLNSIEATFLDEARKQVLKQELDDYYAAHAEDVR